MWCVRVGVEIGWKLGFSHRHSPQKFDAWVSNLIWRPMESVKKTVQSVPGLKISSRVICEKTLNGVSSQPHGNPGSVVPRSSLPVRHTRETNRSEQHFNMEGPLVFCGIFLAFLWAVDAQICSNFTLFKRVHFPVIGKEYLNSYDFDDCIERWEPGKITLSQLKGNAISHCPLFLSWLKYRCYSSSSCFAIGYDKREQICITIVDGGRTGNEIFTGDSDHILMTKQDSGQYWVFFALLLGLCLCLHEMINYKIVAVLSESCHSELCNNGGECFETSEGFWCECPTFHWGETCETGQCHIALFVKFNAKILFWCDLLFGVSCHVEILFSCTVGYLWHWPSL